MEPLSIWTIYDNPADYPGKFVARRWSITDSEIWAHTDDILLADSLEEVRGLLPPGLFPMARAEADVACIIECWI